MKLLMALSRFPFPLDKGDKLRAYHQLKYLGSRHELHLICLSEGAVDAEDKKEIEQYCASLKVIALTSWQSSSKVVKAVLSDLPYQVAYFTNPSVRQSISDCIETRNIDVCYFQLIRMGENIPFESSCKFYIDYMDAFSTNMQRRLPYYSGIKKTVFKSEVKRVRRYEKEILAKVDGASFITETDAAILNDNSVDIIANGVDESFFEENFEGRSFEYDIIFTGNMSYHPNVQAALFLVKKILPELKTKGFDAKVCIAGTSPSKEVQTLAAGNVVVTGRVPDLKPYLRKSRLFVAPLFSGSGLQNKLLESMAMSLPTLSTPLANQALGAPKQALGECPDLESFVREIFKISKDEVSAKQLARNGHAYVREGYQWSNFNQILESRLLNLVAQS